VRFIKRAQRFGLRLEDVGQLLAIRERGLCPCGRTRRMLEEKVSGLTEEMAALHQLRNDIQGMLDERLSPPRTKSGSAASPSSKWARRTTEPRGESHERF
jgi:DNA-binding transcriptional MerR regulator